MPLSFLLWQIRIRFLFFSDKLFKISKHLFSDDVSMSPLSCACSDIMSSIFLITASSSFQLVERLNFLILRKPTLRLSGRKGDFGLSTNATFDGSNPVFSQKLSLSI